MKMFRRLAQRFLQWAKTADWNSIVQGICAVLIGLALGLYGYESKIALLPMQWQLDRQVAEDLASGRDQAQSPSEKEKKKEGGGLFDVFGVSDSVLDDFWEQTGVERYVQNIEKYAEQMVQQGIRGDLKENLDDLMKNGVEPVPSNWTSGENRSFFLFAVFLFLAALVSKILIYLSLLDCNRLRDRWFKIRRAGGGKRRIDWNEILQEFTTLGLSVIGGLYLQPALEEFLKGEGGSYPYPFVLLSVFFGCLLVKMALASSLVDPNAWIRSRGKRPLFSVERFRKFSRGYDWNDLAQQICTIVVSLGLGFYAYESNLALLPLQWQTQEKVTEEAVRREAPQAAPKEKSGGWFDGILPDEVGSAVEKELQAAFQASGAESLAKYAEEFDHAFQDLGVRGGLRNQLESLIREGVQPFPRSWTEPANRPYVIAALAFFFACAVLKFLIYFYVVDMNRLLRKSAERMSSSARKAVDWNTIAQESASILLGATLGLYSEPILDTLAGKPEVGFPYPRLGPCVILGCMSLKSLVYLRIADFNSLFSRSLRPSAPKKKRAAASKHAPKRRKK